jgi:hypothetical protein
MREIYIDRETDKQRERERRIGIVRSMGINNG